jgi:tetratricopeptide (TPR) repeat protein
MSRRNLKYLLVILPVTVFAMGVYAQQDVKLAGIVVEQNSRVKTGKLVYVQGASIKAIQAIPQMSDANGRFTLVFADMPPGNVARIEVDRNGYEVVNSKVLQAAAITGRNAPLEIVLCKYGLLVENQVMYYGIATGATLEQYRRKLMILEQGGKNKDALIAQLQKEMNKVIRSKDEAIKILQEQNQFQQSQSLALANKFVTVNLDDESETYQRAFKAFENKDVEKAISLIDSVNLENRLATNLAELQKPASLPNESPKNIEKRRLQIKQDINQCMFKARLHILKYDYGTARQSYLLALQYDSSNIENLWETATFLLNQKEDTLAKKYFDRVLSLTNTDYTKATALADLGSVYKNIGAYEEAEKYYPQAIKILTQLYTKHPEEYRSTLTDVLNRFGSLYYEWEFYSIANKYFSEADDIYVQSYDSLRNPAIPDAENLTWFEVLNNQCLIFYKNKNYYAAMRQSYFQAIPLLQKLIKKNPGLYTGRLARALYNQGLSNFFLNDYAQAGDDLQEGISETKLLAEKNPDQYAGELADMLDGLGRLFYQLKIYPDAEQFYLESLKIIRKLTEKNLPDQYGTYLAAILNDLSEVYIELKDYKKAASFCGEALKILTPLAEKNPFKYDPQLAAVNHSFGRAYFYLHNYQQAAEYYNNALTYYKKLAEKNPEIYSQDEAIVLYHLGLLNHESKKYETAEKYYLESLGIQSKLVGKEKKATSSAKDEPFVEYLSNLSGTLNALELLYRNWQGIAKANQLYVDAKRDYLQLKEKNKSGPIDSVMRLKDIGKFCYKLEMYSTAEKSFKTALEKFNTLSKEDQGRSYEFNIASTSVDLLSVYQMELETTKDFSYKDKALKFIGKAREWNELDPNAYDYSYNKARLDEFDSLFKNISKTDLTVSTVYLDKIEKKLNLLNEEEKDTATAIAGLEQIIKELGMKRNENPRNQRMNGLLSQAYGSLAWYSVFKKEFTKTVDFAQKGLALDSTQTWIYSNLALGYLLLGKWPEAKKIYAAYKEMYSETFLDDLHALREAGILAPQMREAEAFLLR